MTDKFMLGLRAPFDGFKIIFSNRKNLTFAMIPFLIGLVVVVSSYAVLTGYVSNWIDSILPEADFLDKWETLKSVTDGIMYIVAILLTTIINFLLGYLVIIILAGPFYALMVENIFKVELPDKENRSNLKLAINMFFVGLTKVFVFGFIALACFIMAWIPILNFVAPVIAVLVVAFDCADYAFEVDFLNLRQRFRFFMGHLGAFAGLSTTILIAGFVPGLFFVLLPAFVCGAAKMYIQLSQQEV